MLNMLGALLILLASTLAGFHKARQYALRPRQLRELIAALQRLMTEINYGLTPLPDAMNKMGAQTKEPVRTLFLHASTQMEPPHGLTARESLQAGVEEAWGKSAMKSDEREVMLQLSYSLGTSDRQDQTKHISLAIQQLMHEESRAQADQVKYERMSRSLGMLVGALIVILIF
ncbi:stage III sporulation protein SpoIIIAB [Paenibacillus polysaccharolyticus]|uniref:Stage III sporulation protein AB n=1 Tax=Paenibacillus cucumis (ex Kampfer et al. 2016) TaxID=1776858 RepID=A0ABS7KI70_9BACL|nr:MULTISPECIES: stage III sporulation protein SpoIIIAB [Paenibacillus]MBY0203812.1 stage III sporulation protein AB [Paenibacillus cucumis (ex Kampfer et al. 2016)]MCP1132963.1 stage III sporulation protein SpoIIIAB [Paenibacillus polysaccharolyticus]MDP9699686.1 stage III sporulation protein AB [Paenibacillus intestini]MDT0123669.1 stage III sporulation protein SpoIIIAB [Paenibacillus sp. RRE4]